MVSIREAVRDVIEQRILPWIQRDGISKLILPDQITPDDCPEPDKSNRWGGIQHYEYLLGFGLAGKTPYCIDKKLFVLTPKAIVFIPRWIRHGTVQTVRRFRNFGLGRFASTLWLMPLRFGAHAQILYDTGDSNIIEASHPYMLIGYHFDGLAISLMEEVQSRPPNYARVGQAILVEFLERCLQSFAVSDAVDEAPSMTDRSASKHISQSPVQAAQEFIHTNYHAPINRDDIADAADASITHLSRQFKAAVGMTLMQYLLKIRIESAKQLLLSDMRVAEVASMVGISDFSYFTRIFHRVNGMSPTQYRRRITTDPESARQGEASRSPAQSQKVQ